VLSSDPESSEDEAVIEKRIEGKKRTSINKQNRKRISLKDL
jgi:hypothetical protein